MAVGRGSIIRAAKAQSRTKEEPSRNVEFLTRVTEEVPESKGERSREETNDKPSVSIKDPMPFHLL